ncbi:LOW QUALITY PROTEIN: pleckstrin homology domain-containing family A member 8 [Erpetoichthys calabaricus]|uniref:LOW QUALITY PROTEIN: pleckstrin homology domain-containing family A member 8 n=1 Tax=Erpetoichthys calabaricus TaxID=27687 RepID=UPI0022347E29|nr:LOW QUALITY PROTEIN: pleckstrin homology domain-containing family A member 8 [Erpetoichthys calabaricus]
MEGMLYKWTNYLSGWQPRWFVLEGGTLSYYDSEDDAWKGCKGSIKMSVCEIQVHTDNTRMDLIIPGEQCFYLKAINAAERQKWLVALGTAKACLTDSRTKKEKEVYENTEALKKKMSELRLYCDLLLQQVNTVKECPVPGRLESNTVIDGHIDMATLVKSTCNTFLKTLEECMQIAEKPLMAELLCQTPPGSPPVTAIKPSKVKHSNPASFSATERWKELNNNLGSSVSLGKHKSIQEVKRPQIDNLNSWCYCYSSKDLVPVKLTDCVKYTEESTEIELSNDTQWAADLFCKEEMSRKSTESALSAEEFSDVLVAEAVTEEDEEEEQIETFFSAMGHRFSDINLEEENGIPTEPFLESCYSIVPVLDKLGPTVFAPVKIDFVGNIKKIQQKYITDTEKFKTLQKIVLYEVDTGVAQVRNSATEALLWLKRGLKFLKEFLGEVNQGERDIHNALNNAYGKTLRQYHGWVVRGVFALALRAAPTFDVFTAALVSNEGDEKKKSFFQGMHRDLNTYLPAMENQLGILDAIYEEYGLESDEVV